MNLVLLNQRDNKFYVQLRILYYVSFKLLLYILSDILIILSWNNNSILKYELKVFNVKESFDSMYHSIIQEIKYTIFLYIKR